jgi:septum formation protein
MQLILASGSPRRRELLTISGYDFDVAASDTDENVTADTPAELVVKLAAAKASAVKDGRKNCCVIGSDTIVVLDGEIMGKPKNADEAFNILRKLSGKTHIVYTGIAVLSDEGGAYDYDHTRVTFSELTDDEIRSYIKTGEPMDKAGAYGIQGSAGIFVQKVEGSYFTVIGLPLPKLYKMLRDAGITPRWMSESFTGRQPLPASTDRP